MTIDLLKTWLDEKLRDCDAKIKETQFNPSDTPDEQFTRGNQQAIWLVVGDAYRQVRKKCDE